MFKFWTLVFEPPLGA